ncbi:MAG TPA: hypothetical protein VMW75_10010 [Thermoanaerobaculia bacterium]|nr:hypothetical protein [Thermoanaerobaculia bacterium]
MEVNHRVFIVVKDDLTMIYVLYSIYLLLFSEICLYIFQRISWRRRAAFWTLKLAIYLEPDISGSTAGEPGPRAWSKSEGRDVAPTRCSAAAGRAAAVAAVAAQGLRRLRSPAP